ncbi:hypothetical protein J3F83DRAFT_418373 [Trichoderma novae-zelandiae]
MSGAKRNSFSFPFVDCTIQPWVVILMGGFPCFYPYLFFGLGWIGLDWIGLGIGGGGAGLVGLPDSFVIILEFSGLLSIFDTRCCLFFFLFFSSLFFLLSLNADSSSKTRF